MNTKEYIELALKVSMHSEYKQKLGCVIVKRNKIVGIGFNKPYKTHPKSNNQFKNIHAELDAMLGVSFRDLLGATAYVARQHKDGTHALAKPCPCCMELLTNAGIKRVYWTNKLVNGLSYWFTDLY